MAVDRDPVLVAHLRPLNPCHGYHCLEIAFPSAIQKINRKAVSNAAKVIITAAHYWMFHHYIFPSVQVHKFMIAPTDFSLAGGELTPTMKVKRHFVIEKYQKKIQQMYEHETQSSMWWWELRRSDFRSICTISPTLLYSCNVILNHHT